MMTELVAAQPGQWARSLYCEAFPAAERRPLEQLLRGVERGDIRFLEVRVGGRPVGFMTLWTFPGQMAYLEHFAIMPGHRGKSFGADAVARLLRLVAPLPLVLEIERPEGEGSLTRRRHDFYCRRGMRPLDRYDYIQPPYSPGLPAVPMLLMASADIDPAAAADLLYTRVYNQR